MERRFPGYNRRDGYIIGPALPQANNLPVAAQPLAAPAAPAPVPAAPAPTLQAAPSPALPAPPAAVAALPALDLSPEEEVIMFEDYSREWREALAGLQYRRRILERVPLEPRAISAIVNRWATPGALIRELRVMEMADLCAVVAAIDTGDPEWVRDWWRNNIGPDRMVAIMWFVFRGMPRGIRQLCRHYGEEDLLPSSIN